jgi:glycosyltransferase involved in cell wall biosynthesis
MPSAALSISKDLAPIAASRKPQHVLYVFDHLRNLDGGAERSLLKIVQMLPPDRYRASIVTFCRPSDLRFLGQFPCPVHLLPLKRSYGWRSLQVARLIRDIIQCEQVSVVQTFFASSDLWGGAVARLSGCPVLISSRRDMGFQRQLKHRLAYRLMGRMFDQVHTVSEAVRRYTIRQDRLPEGRVISIPNGVDMENLARDFDPRFRARHALDHASHLIVDVGSVKPVKGYDVLARTASIVCREFPRAVFAIAGALQDHAYYGQLRELISGLGLDGNVRFLGNLDPAFAFLQSSDVFCHLSRTDGLSNALLEAMATGLPCVLSRVGGNPEVVSEGRSGFLVPSDDPESAARRILELLRDPEMRRRMGDHGRAIVAERFTAAHMVNRLVSLYDDLLAAKMPRQWGAEVA